MTLGEALRCSRRRSRSRRCGWHAQSSSVRGEAKAHVPGSVGRAGVPARCSGPARRLEPVLPSRSVIAHPEARIKRGATQPRARAAALPCSSTKASVPRSTSLADFARLTAALQNRAAVDSRVVGLAFALKRPGTCDAVAEDEVATEHNMTNRFLLTPMSLDQPTPELRRLRREGWSINETGSCARCSGAAADRRGQRTDRPLHGGSSARRRSAGVSHGRLLCGDRRADRVAARRCRADAPVARCPRRLQHAGDNPERLPGRHAARHAHRPGDLEILDALRAHTIDDDAVVLYDARDLDPLEREALAASRVTHVTSIDALDSFDFGRGPVHVHLDPDVLNPLDAPAMAYPAPGGPDLAVLSRVLSRLAGRGVAITSVTLTTWAVDRDGSGGTEAAVWQLLESLLGERIR